MALKNDDKTAGLKILWLSAFVSSNLTPCTSLQKRGFRNPKTANLQMQLLFI